MRRVGLRRMCGGGHSGSRWRDFRLVPTRDALINDRAGWALVWAKPMWPTRRQNRIGPRPPRHIHIRVPTRWVDAVCWVRGHQVVHRITGVTGLYANWHGGVGYRETSGYDDCSRCGRRLS